MYNAMLIAAACVALLYVARQRHLILAAVGDEDMKIAIPGDEDMKIAPSGSFSPAPVPEDSSELAASQFLDLKRSGDIDKARGLGERYAAMLLEKGGALSVLTRGGEESLRIHQQLVLCSYAVTRVISEHSPNSILAQTALNVFYSRLEEESPEIYRHVSDMAAFSLYILCERSQARTNGEIGAVYARLCGSADDARTADEGNELYHRLYDCFTEEYKKTAYSTR